MKETLFQKMVQAMVMMNKALALWTLKKGLCSNPRPLIPPQTSKCSSKFCGF